MKRKLAQLNRMQDFEDDSIQDKRPSEPASDDEDSFSSGSEEAASDEDETLLTARDLRVLAERKQREDEKKRIVPYTNKQKVLVLCSRGITTRYRHFMEDVRALMPHHSKEVKHDTKKRLHEINEICEMKSCNGCMFFEVRKKKDLYLWITRAPNGPSIKFLVSNVHTMDELQMVGNCLFGSRPLLSFTTEFDTVPFLQLAKEILSTTFGTPRGHPKSKPFMDRIMQFSFLDGKIWCRNFQISDETKDEREITKIIKAGEDSFDLNEIGPRFVLTVVKIFDGGFGGRPLYENPEYVSPNEVRSLRKKELGLKYANRKSAEKAHAERSDELQSSIPVDRLADKRVFR